ncbi:hemerythrin domain-containing protein, partial [Nonomuraea sp. KC401]
MYVIHRAMLTDLRRITEVLGGTDPLTGGRNEAVRAYAASVLTEVHHHHANEDGLLWPIIERTAGHAVDLSPYTDDHQVLGPVLDRCRAALRGERHVLRSRLAELTDFLDEHIAEEEPDLFPIIFRFVPYDAYAWAERQIAKRAVRATDLHGALAAPSCHAGRGEPAAGVRGGTAAHPARNDQGPVRQARAGGFRLVVGEHPEHLALRVGDQVAGPDPVGRVDEQRLPDAVEPVVGIHDHMFRGGSGHAEVFVRLSEQYGQGVPVVPGQVHRGAAHLAADGRLADLTVAVGEAVVDLRVVLHGHVDGGIVRIQDHLDYLGSADDGLHLGDHGAYTGGGVQVLVHARRARARGPGDGGLTAGGHPAGRLPAAGWSNHGAVPGRPRNAGVDRGPGRERLPHQHAGRHDGRGGRRERHGPRAAARTAGARGPRHHPGRHPLGPRRSWRCRPSRGRG